MTLRRDISHPVRLSLRHAAVQEDASASGLVRLARPQLYIDREGMRLEGHSRGGARRWTIPYTQVIESRGRGRVGLFLYLKPGERMFLDVHDRDEYLSVDVMPGVPCASR